MSTHRVHTDEVPSRNLTLSGCCTDALLHVLGMQVLTKTMQPLS
jgi:hypothetical protein